MKFSTLLFVAALLCTAELNAQQPSLRGLEGLHVRVEHRTHDARPYLPEDMVRDWVEQHFREEGIAVLSEEQRLAAPARQYFHVNISSIDNKRGSFIYDLDLHVRQTVTLATGVSVEAATWEDEYLGRVSKQSFQKIIQEVLKQKLEKFTSDYLAANRSQ